MKPDQTDELRREVLEIAEYLSCNGEELLIEVTKLVVDARISQTNDLNTKIFYKYANPDGQYIKDLMARELAELRQKLGLDS